MKTYKEITDSLLERKEMHDKKQRNKNKIITASLSSVFALCLVAGISLALTLPRDKGNDSSMIDGDYSSIKNQALAQGVQAGNDISASSQPHIYEGAKVDEDNTQDVMRWAWVINEIDIDKYVSAAKLNFSEDKFDKKTLSLEDTKNYFGKALYSLEAAMPNGFEYSGAQSFNFYSEKEGGLAYDSCSFRYELKNSDAKIIIKASKVGVPYDCLYCFKEEETIVSGMAGVPNITLGAIYGGEGFELLYADFEKDGINYRIEIWDTPYDEETVNGFMQKLIACTAGV